MNNKKHLVETELMLVSPSKDLKEDICKYKEEHFAYGDLQVHGSCGLAYYDDIDEWINLVLEIRKTRLRNGVHTSTFFSRRIEDGKLVGCIKIHHSLTDELRNGGHIAYGIRPSERNKGYGKQQLQLCLEYAKKLQLTKVIIACDKENTASAMTAMSCGGILSKEFVEDGITKQHYYIEI